MIPPPYPFLVDVRRADSPDRPEVYRCLTFDGTEEITTFVAREDRAAIYALLPHGTTERPTVPGFYWFHEPEFTPVPVVVHVYADTHGRLFASIPNSPGDRELGTPPGFTPEIALTAMWWGPLPRPEVEHCRGRT